MRVAVTGATGTIGRAAIAALRDRGDEVVALSRDADRARGRLPEGVAVHAWSDPLGTRPPAEALAGADAILHLLGEPIDQRWSEEAKRRIRDSRVLPTRNLVEALGPLDPRPRVLVSQSASGYYGGRGDEAVDESEPPGTGFLADTVAAWEREASRAEEVGLRVTLARSGVVLTPEGGALAKMLPPFKLGVGGPVAGGRQYFPWIHLEDEAAALVFLLDEDGARGPVNLVAPTAATNGELSKALGRVLARPAVAPVPGLALRVLYGEMAELITEGVRMVPRRLEELGFRFSWPELEPALRDATGR